MALSTKDVKSGEGGLPKTIQPGNTKAVILGVSLNQPAFLKEKDGYFVVLELMGPKPTEDFEGFLIDKDNPDGPRYEGPVGRVKSSRWAYQDSTTKSGVAISRDNEIMKFIKNLCEELGGKSKAWWDASDNKYETIEELVEGFNSDAPFKGASLEFCICGRGYHNTEGYVNYDLYLPKFSKQGIPFEAAGKAKSRLLVFNEEDHVEEPEAREVEEFSGDDNSAPAADDADFSTEGIPPAEFEL
jgi:hypothetical protein